MTNVCSICSNTCVYWKPFFRCPKDEEISSLWSEWVNVQNGCERIKTNFVCGNHFAEEVKGMRKLKKGAVPSIPVVASQQATAESLLFDDHGDALTASNEPLASNKPTTSNACTISNGPTMNDGSKDNSFDKFVDEAVASKMYSSLLQIDVCDFRHRHPSNICEVRLQTYVAEVMLKLFILI